MTTSADRIQQLLTERGVLLKRLRAHHKSTRLTGDGVVKQVEIETVTMNECDICLDADESGDE